jgi:hypothetical protein
MSELLQRRGKRRGPSVLTMHRLRVLLFAGLSSVALAAHAAEPAPTVTLEGTVVVQVEDDFEHARSRTRYFLLEHRSKERMELQLGPEQAQRIRSGQQLRVRGTQSGKALATDPDTDAVTVLTKQTSLVAPALTAHSVITLIVDITDGSGQRHTISDTCDGTAQVLADQMFGSQTGRLNVDGCFRDSSYDVLGFGGRSYPGTAMDVVRVATTDASPSLAGVCNYELWQTNADAAAIAQGVDPSAYQHRMYVIPAAVGCYWAGLGYLHCLPGTPCRAWAKAYNAFPCAYPDILAHELGHNIGLQHSSSANLDGTNDCGYCDTSDVMGYAIGTLRGINAPHRGYLGWLGDGRIVDGASGGVFTISALGIQSPSNPQAVKIVPPDGGTYWLSYRAPIGYDTQLETRYFNTLSVHRSGFGADSVLVALLADGATHFNESLNLTVRQLSHTADSATLEVQYGAAFSLSATSLEFGYQFLNVASSTQTITLLSTGGKALPIPSIAIGGANPFEFAQTNDCGTSLAPGASCTIAVTFKPTGTGPKAATLTVAAAGGAATRTTLLSGIGEGATYTLSTSSLAFGNQALSVASTKTITLRSTGVTALQITSIAVVGAHSVHFSQTNNCGTSVAAGASCAIKVTFKPTTAGLKAATVTVTTGGGSGTKSTAVSGTGVRPAYTLSASSLAFGKQPLNLASSAKTITLRSTGIVALPITSISFIGTNPTMFAQTNNCGTSVAAGASCTITIRFKPTSTGPKIANLRVAAGSGAGIKYVTVSGTAVRSAFSISPTALSFGNVPRNTTSSAKVVRISNTGSVVLPISSIVIAGTNPGQFARTTNCSTQVAIGGSCTVSVVFKPTSTGAKFATLQVTPGGGAALKSVALSGTGI